MGNWKGVSYQLSYLRKNKTKRYDTRKAHECNVWREGEGQFRSERGEWSSRQYWRTYWSSQGVRSKWREESFTQPKDQKIKVICLSEMLVKIKANIKSSTPTSYNVEWSVELRLQHWSHPWNRFILPRVWIMSDYGPWSSVNRTEASKFIRMCIWFSCRNIL